MAAAHFLLNKSQNLVLDQEKTLYLTSFSVLMTCLSVQILKGEVTRKSPLGVKGLRHQTTLLLALHNNLQKGMLLQY